VVAGYVYKGMAKDGQTAMYVEAGKEHRHAGGPPPVHRSRNDRPSVSPATLEAAHEAAIAALTPEKRSALAAELSLPEGVLAELAIGWSNTAQHHTDHEITGAYIFPEYDGQGRLVGASYRFPAASVAGRTDADGKPIGNKSGPAGLRRGLTLPSGWRDMPDPVLVVEGPSDVLAARAVGVSAIGRPSNSGGVEFIAQLCRHRRVTILGENDRKSDGRWPGKEGAELVARKLEAAWGRPVPVVFPPDGIKDLRDWVRQLAGDWATANPAAIREAILAAVQPPALLLLAQPATGHRRVVLKVFRWADGVEAAALHSDLLHLEDAAARKRFVKAVAQIAPETNADDLMRQLLILKVPAGGSAKPPSSPTASAPADAIRDTSAAVVDGSAPETPPTVGNSLPQVFLPGGPIPITQSAAILGGLMARTDKYYLRGGAVVTLGKDDDGLPVLEVIKPAALASVFETVAKLMKHYKEKTGFVPYASPSCEQDAKLIQHCAAFQQLLPPIRLLSRCPVLIERDGRLMQICGYDRASAIMAFGDQVPEMPLEEAVAVLLEVVFDFRFATAADRARALASIVTPALIFGGLLRGRAPVDLSEADTSQAGKGFKNKTTAAIYGHIVKTVTQKKGGVGSMEESFATALIQGYTFISFDNVRSAIDSPAIESFLTEDTFLARSPHLAAIEIDPSRVIVQLTSNRAEVTTDLASRSSCVRILKQPEGYRFREYPKGSILEHIRANQPLYLGAVFAVVKAWHAAGKPRTDDARHDFRAWAGRLDWIVQNIFRAGPLLEGHRETQVRMSTPVLNWLRSVALAVRTSGQMGLWLRANSLIDIANASGTELPALPEGADIADEEVHTKVLQGIGRRMAQCFGAGKVRVIDGFEIQRRELDDPQNRRTTREYCFRAVVNAPEPVRLWAGDPGIAIGAPIGAKTVQHPSGPAPDTASSPMKPAEGADCAYAAPMRAPMNAPMKLPCAPIAPMGSVIARTEDQNTRGFNNVSVLCANSAEVIEPIGAIGALPIPPDAVLKPELTALLADPRRRWCEQAEALVAGRPDEDREDLLHVFDEREAIAAIDGGLDDEAAGQLAYQQVLSRLGDDPVRTAAIGETP
jgi:hypothetical protein